MNAQLFCGGNSDMIAAVSDSGWINETLFVDWLHHYISYATPSVKKQILPVLDNQRVSLACYLLWPEFNNTVLFRRILHIECHLWI